MLEPQFEILSSKFMQKPSLKAFTQKVYRKMIKKVTKNNFKNFFSRPKFKNVSWPICGFYFVFWIFNIFLMSFIDLRPLPGFPHLIAQNTIFAIFPLLAHRARLLTVHLKKWDGPNWNSKKAIFKQIDETSNLHRFLSAHSTNKPRVWNEF